MKTARLFKDVFDRKELKVFARLDSPRAIQSFLDRMPYSAEERYRCPRSVLRDRTAHCFDGALFAAAALRRLGHRPLILDMLPNDRDDDHLLALFKRRGCWGAVAKSNFVGLRYREPVYRSVRELVMSYFEFYYNIEGEKTLRAYTTPLNLTPFDKQNWMANDEPLDAIADRLDEIRKYPVLARGVAARLSAMDKRTYTAGMLGVNHAGLYKP